MCNAVTEKKSLPLCICWGFWSAYTFSVWVESEGDWNKWQWPWQLIFLCSSALVGESFCVRMSLFRSLQKKKSVDSSVISGSAVVGPARSDRKGERQPRECQLRPHSGSDNVACAAGLNFSALSVVLNCPRGSGDCLRPPDSDFLLPRSGCHDSTCNPQEGGD